MTHITLEMARDALKEVVENYGEEYVYSHGYARPGTCWYASPPGRVVDHSEDAPGCGVGCALFALGMSIEELRLMDAEIGEAIDNFASLPGGWSMDDDAASYFAIFQQAQDNGTQWGTALERAETAADEPQEDSEDWDVEDGY